MRPCESWSATVEFMTPTARTTPRRRSEVSSEPPSTCLARSVVLNPLRTIALLSGLVVLGACTGVDPATELAAARQNMAARQYGEAAIRLSNVVQAQPDNPEARRMRGELALINGESPTAAEELERARALGVEVDSLAVSLADAWTMVGREDEALSLLDSVAPAHVADATYWVVRAEALLRSGRIADAERALDSGAQAGDTGMRGRIARAAVAFARDDVA